MSIFEVLTPVIDILGAFNSPSRDHLGKSRRPEISAFRGRLSTPSLGITRYIVSDSAAVLITFQLPLSGSHRQQ